MENASTALLMAGGMLLAILILSLVAYMFTAARDMENAKEEKLVAQQISEFNAGYEAYNKKLMYGTEIISVVNKAIDYNKRLDSDEEKYKINIVLILNQDFNTTREKVIERSNGTKEYQDLGIVSVGTLKTGEYQLFQREGSLKMDDDVINFFHQKSNSDEPIVVKNGSTIEITYTYSAITQFKKAVFECISVEYDNTGRVKEMKFRQKDINTKYY